MVQLFGRDCKLWILFICLSLYTCEATSQQNELTNKFDAPRRRAIQAAMQRQVPTLFAESKYAQAEQILLQITKQIPDNAHAFYNLACALARQGKSKEALDNLAQAVKLGFRNRSHIVKDEDLKSLRDEEGFDAILKASTVPLVPVKLDLTPAMMAAGQVVIGEENVVWDADRGIFLTQVEFGKTTDSKIANGKGEVADLLRKWHEEGTAAGNHGDLYDNHDRDHSNMNYGALPQLTRVEYSEAAQKRQLNNGLQRSFLFNQVTIGNSSTALTSGPYWRCQGRNAITQPVVANFLYLQYRANHLYFYPEHRDYDPGHNGKDEEGNGGHGYGDVFPANTPYIIISQGSSGSDRAFMNAVAMTLAAFHPDVKEQLVKHGMLMPALQMIFRMSNKTVAEQSDYLKGRAHPTVFDGDQIDVLKMVTMAHDLKPGSLPPLARIKVVEEDEFVVGRDYFDVAAREQLFDTPCAIARVVKSTKYQRRMVVNADTSADIHNKSLKFHWVVLRGDADKVQIVKRNDAGSEIELQLSHHERRPIAPQAKMQSNRVDIGLFVHNGDYYSAPAIISFYYLDNQKREYDDKNRIRSVDYTIDNYVDPLLDFRKNWRDEYQYGDDGMAKGWTRIRGADRQEFNAAG
ncbi:MAG: hypothetical protein ACI9G1_001220, partial [Pirellulaceae bacterium]